MLMKNIKPLAELSWVSFCSVIENLDVCFSFPLIVYTEIIRSRTATVFLTVLSFPRPCLLLYSICIFIGDYSVACHRLQYGRSCTSLIKIFVSVLVFLYVNLEVSVYFSAGRKI